MQPARACRQRCGRAGRRSRRCGALGIFATLHRIPSGSAHRVAPAHTRRFADTCPRPVRARMDNDNRTHKRRSDDDDIVHKTLLEMCGNDSWSPVLCGYAHKLKRPKLQLYDDDVRNAMIGVY